MISNRAKIEQEVRAMVDSILDFSTVYSKDTKVSAVVVGNAFINLVIRTVPHMALDLEGLRQLGDRVKSAIIDAGVQSGKEFK